MALVDVPAAESAEQPAPTQPSQLLRLMDDDAVSEDSMLAAIARRHASGASLHLLLLAQRFGVLFARPALAAEALPLGPLAFGHSLSVAVHDHGLSGHTRMALSRLYSLELSEPD